MKISEAGIGLIKQFEGCCLVAYKDVVGVPTIGWGHIENVLMGQSITQAKADELLSEDIAVKAGGVNNLITAPVTQGQFDALVSFAFNLGLGNLKKSTLLRKVNAGEPAGSEFLRWNMAGGKVVAGLTRRRQAEKDLFES